jgi:hypothetical protein
MTKNQTVDLLRSQMPGFYSVEQVINLIEKIEESKGKVITVTEIGAAIDKLVDSLERNEDEIVDTDSIELSLSYDNRIEFDRVRINFDYIREALENTFMDFGEQEEEVEAERTTLVEGAEWRNS